MPLLDKTSSPSGHSAIRFSLLHLNICSLNRNFDKKEMDRSRFIQKLRVDF